MVEFGSDRNPQEISQGIPHEFPHEIKEKQGTIVIVDDDPEMGSLLKDFLSSEGYKVATYANPLEVASNISTMASEIDLLITDLRMPGISGLELIEQVHKVDQRLPIILITAFGSVSTAVQAIRQGAFDYIVKPFKLGEIGITIDRAIAFRRLHNENQILRNEVQQSWSLGNIIGKSQAMQPVLDLVKRVAKATANVLITGESGTGKEVIARTIHQMGPRSHKNFVGVNCASIPDTLLESELFGHARGAFTGAIARKKGLFEEAEGGTIFLDEIGDLNLSLQAKLLRVIQERAIKAVGDNSEKEINVRIITATNKDLKTAIEQGQFRDDLYYRLSVIPIVLPPLRHRKEDIPILADYFLKKYVAANNSEVTGFTKAALARLINLRWEGNVRELENVIERAVVLTNKKFIDIEDLPTPDSNNVESFFGQAAADLPTLANLEQRYISWVLSKTGGRKEKAAHILGINRRTLYRKEREHDAGPTSDLPLPQLDDSGNFSTPASDAIIETSRELSH